MQPDHRQIKEAIIRGQKFLDELREYLTRLEAVIADLRRKAARLPAHFPPAFSAN